MVREKRIVREKLDIDIGRTDLLTILNRYGKSTKTTLKSNKEKFKEYYRTSDLEMYKDIYGEKKFIIPYEMADLYSMMTATMKSSPTYDDRKGKVSLQDIITHNENVIKYVDYLPAQISDYIKTTSEYYNALCFINYVPAILERMSALLYLAIDETEVPIQKIFDYLIEGLDDAYENYFWQVARKESISELLKCDKVNYKHIFRSDYNIDTSKVYHSLDAVLAELLKKLDRSNWPAGVDSKVKELLKKWGEKYCDMEDKEERVKNEYLIWLCHQKWHVLNKTITTSISTMFATDDLIKENIKNHNKKYNKDAIMHPLFLNKNEITVDEDNNICKEFMDRIDNEMSLIRQSLQNEIDSYIIQELLRSHKDLKVFAEKFQHPFVIHLSSSIYVFIKNLIEANLLEISFVKKLLHLESVEDTHELLRAYLRSINEILYEFDSKYKRYGLLNYVESILKGTKDIQSCCSDIYIDVFVKIQSQKCDHFIKNKKDYDYLSDDIGDSLGDGLRQIIMKEYFKRQV